MPYCNASARFRQPTANEDPNDRLAVERGEREFSEVRVSMRQQSARGEALTFGTAAVGAFRCRLSGDADFEPQPEWRASIKLDSEDRWREYTVRRVAPLGLGYTVLDVERV